LDKSTRRLISDVLVLFLLLFFTILGYWVYSAPAILLAGGLALTVWVAADIILFRKA
jgi:small neutral amino acid transporter SnatA (MarC family)